MSTHAPGPWAVNFGRISFSGCRNEHCVKDGYLAYRPIDGSAFQGGGYDLKAADGSVVFSHVWDTLNLEQTQANARLIAAAPELLEAATFVLRYLDGHKCINNEEQRATLEAAIAKAMQP